MKRFKKNMEEVETKNYQTPNNFTDKSARFLRDEAWLSKTGKKRGLRESFRLSIQFQGVLWFLAFKIMFPL